MEHNRSELPPFAEEAATLFETLGIPALFFGADHRVRHVTSALEQLIGGGDGRGQVDRAIRDWLTRDRNIQGPWDRFAEADLQMCLPDGRTWTVRVWPPPTAGETMTGGIAVFFDTTARSHAEDRQSAALNELNHRLKNTLMIAPALVSQILRTSDSPEAFEKMFRARWAALGRAQVLLKGADQASLHEIVLTETAPYRSRESQVVVSGPPNVFVSSHAIPALAMVLHEFATNAAKYGALSNDQGILAVGWGLSPAAARPRLAITWAESGGPAVHVPARPGLGTRLIERGVEEVNGRLTAEFRATGVKYALAVPLTASLGYWHVDGGSSPPGP